MSILVSVQLGVPRSTREICHKLAELGWLFRKVRAFIDGKKMEKTAGLVVQVRGSSVKRCGLNCVGLMIFLASCE